MDFPVTDQKKNALLQRMEELNIKEEDLQEKFVHGGGKGGQKVNKSNNCVELVHIPTNTRVKCHKDRSLALNRFFARRLLADSIEELLTGKCSKKQLKEDKIRKQKKRRARRHKAKSAPEENQQDQ